MTLHSYTAPGERHVVLADGGFYDETVDGTALVDWVGDIVVGRSGRGRALRGLLRRLKPASHM